MKRQKTSNNNTYGEIEVTISENSSYGVKGADTICIPDGNGGKINLKDSSNKSGAKYKIKKGSESGSNTTLCLEKSGSGSSGSCSS